ncbi:hypothetical protein [Hymenobacter jeollabukensis]|uniref:Uncharacterized protein n=1 Tax=Hymenobacter jeollabukensis TaxID=2025313 RepID=A0A5R8WR74_9BACT|nr:hypothetical protein [Hymenobacter jeollabukensis]TLM93235.1 hypothetical protein FDY95_11470 [Hymenobacter jeollabukensis]
MGVDIRVLIPYTTAQHETIRQWAAAVERDEVPALQEYYRRHLALGGPDFELAGNNWFDEHQQVPRPATLPDNYAWLVSRNGLRFRFWDDCLELTNDYRVLALIRQPGRRQLLYWFIGSLFELLGAREAYLLGDDNAAYNFFLRVGTLVEARRLMPAPTATLEELYVDLGHDQDLSFGEGSAVGVYDVVGVMRLTSTAVAALPAWVEPPARPAGKEEALVQQVLFKHRRRGKRRRGETPG